MSNTVIKVDNISKYYRLGVVNTGTLKDDIRLRMAKMRGKEADFYKIGEDRSTDSDFMWALNDISFEVNQGEVLGIVGKNGAGKSTLLKILSCVTAPTSGNIKVKGRIASLLEVGTGFHPELTGRENIFLNGAILGMSKQEIKSKFDEIVDFSGVERYIDTPVKRYSSGMYVRLAFAVAAHLACSRRVICRACRLTIAKPDRTTHRAAQTPVETQRNQRAQNALSLLANRVTPFAGHRMSLTVRR